MHVAYHGLLSFLQLVKAEVEYHQRSVQTLSALIPQLEEGIGELPCSLKSVIDMLPGKDVDNQSRRGVKMLKPSFRNLPARLVLVVQKSWHFLIVFLQFWFMLCIKSENVMRFLLLFSSQSGYSFWLAILNCNTDYPVVLLNVDS